MARRDDSEDPLFRGLPGHCDARYTILNKKVFDIQQKLTYTENDGWYNFGKLTRSRKLLVIIKVLTKKLYLHKVIYPLVRFIKYRVYEENSIISLYS